MGYAFVNFTTAEAARGLQRALHGCRWKRSAFDSGKIIDIRAARIQVRNLNPTRRDETPRCNHSYRDHTRSYY